MPSGRDFTGVRASFNFGFKYRAVPAMNGGHSSDSNLEALSRWTASACFSEIDVLKWGRDIDQRDAIGDKP